MAHTIHVGDLVRANTNPNLSEYNNGVVLEIQGENVKIALPHSNRSIRYVTRRIGDAFVQPLTKKMVTDGVITEGQYNEAIQFRDEMEKEIDSSGERVLGRVNGGRKKTNKKRKSKSFRSKKRKSKRVYRK